LRIAALQFNEIGIVLALQFRQGLFLDLI